MVQNGKLKSRLIYEKEYAISLYNCTKLDKIVTI